MTSPRPVDGHALGRITVVDDHDLLGESLVVALREHGFRARRLRVVSAPQLREAFLGHAPGVALLDLDLGHDLDGRPIEGLDLLGRLATAGWLVVVVSGTRNPADRAAAISAGASGFMHKSVPLPELVAAVSDVCAGRPLLSPAERAHWSEVHRRHCELRRREAERLEGLTSREREVLELLSTGQRVSVIADRFVVSEATVRSHVKSVLRKLGVSSQIEAVAVYRATPPP